ncbi:MAG: toll/interleukin-1 receptor domain-containing protein, partial [Muribaculaceae bacterium]
MAQHHKMEYDIFISYSRKDFNEVKALYEMLKSRISNINIWFDLTGIESGDEFDEKIIAAIDNSKMLLFALSDNSNQSKWAKDEVMYAKNTEKRIIPVLMKGACLKGWFLFKFGRIDCIDLQDEKQVNKMLHNFSEWFDKKLVNEPASSPKASQSHQTSAAKSAAALSPEDMFQNGLEHYDKKNYTEAVKWYRKAAEQGHAGAQNNLGVCYENGYGVTKDYYEAVKWYRKAAEQGNARAQCNLGVCYEYGQGVTKSITEAVKWYRKAAAQDYAPAQDNLGDCYFLGNGVTQDYAEAVKWYRKAAEQGFAHAQCNLGLCYIKGDGVTQDFAEAAKWYRKAAEQGLARAQCNLGLCYKKGLGVTKSITEAVKWYRKAAEQGNAPA